MAKLIVKNRYGTIPNEILCNPNISLKAKGLWAYIQSKPDDWDFSVHRIPKETSDSIRAVRSGLAELEENGLLERKRGQDLRVTYILKSAKMLTNETLTNETLTNETLTVSKKDITKKELTKKDNTTEHSSEVNVIIALFHDSINPTINFGNKSTRKATEDMLKRFGLEGLTSMVKQTIAIQGQPYAPVVTTPYQMKEKLAQIKLFLDKINNNTVNEYTI